MWERDRALEIGEILLVLWKTDMSSGAKQEPQTSYLYLSRYEPHVSVAELPTAMKCFD